MNAFASRVLQNGSIVLALACAIAPVYGQGQAQNYPNRPIRFIVGFLPGGSSDLVSRLLGQKISERLGQPVVVENNPAGGGTGADLAVARAAPDGYHLVLLSGGVPSAAAVRKALPYDPAKDFAHISTVTTYPMVISVVPNSPHRTLADLLAFSKANPGKVSFSMSMVGSLHHLLGEWINIEAGTTMLGVPYKGPSAAILDVAGGRVDVMIETATFSFGQIRGGKLRPLALSSEARYPLLPDAPTVAETLPAIAFSSWLGLVTSPGTPRAIVDILNREVRAIVEMPDVKQRLADMGGVPSPSTPEEMRARIEREVARWKHVVEVKNIERQ
ncbi:MAG: Bug family tripartite tricarboxylate transporter substrate binding protein [Burkholderiales bacterium]